jgi:branched-subunit amino acid aminotransferase/4-amino-4-deoxychorismate lyase
MGKYIVSRNGVVLSWEELYKQYPPDNRSSSSNTQSEQYLPMDASTLLQRLPRGAYTTCRTVKNGTHIYQFDYHMRRLASSSASILESISASTSGEKRLVQENDSLSASNHPTQHHRNPSKFEVQNMNIVKEGWEREMALKCIRPTLDAFRSLCLNDSENDTAMNNKIPGAEFRITLLATWEQNNQKDNFESALYCHIGLLKNNAGTSLIRVLVHGHGRENAFAKDSKWVTDRKQLIDSNGYEEIILINNKGELLEGTQTNFYVVLNASNIITANEGVLFGSVRDSVLRVCSKHNIHVDLRPPTIEDLKHATGVFISSTSRWVMPVHEVHLGDLLHMTSDCSSGNDEREDGSMQATYHYDNCPTTDRIRKWVLEDVETHSTMIY